MQSKNISVNFVFNFIKTLLSLLFPVITFSYSSRILGVDGVGQVNFAKSVISYFTMFAMLGMNYYGTREAAKRRDNKNELSRFVHEMLIINGITTLIAYIVLIVMIFQIDKFKNYQELLLINSISICMMGMGMEWLYQALEEYAYITIRVVAFQILALGLMFLMVKDAGDVSNYAIVTVLATSGSYIFNFINVRKYISLHRFKGYAICKHLKPLLWLFALAVSIELYTVLDSTMLGFLKGDTSVGLYTAAIKINKIVNSLITSLGVVLIPRLSYYIGKGEDEKLKELINKSYQFVFMLSVPACIGLFLLSDEIVLFFSGSEFLSAGLTMRILTPIVLFIPFSVVTNQQTLVPMGKEQLILRATCVGAVMNIIGNQLLIPVYAENGAAVATVISEMAVAIVCYMNAKKYLFITVILKKYYQYWIAALPIILIGYLVKSFVNNNVGIIIVTCLLSAVCYFAALYIMKNQYLLEALEILRKRFRR